VHQPEETEPEDQASDHLKNREDLTGPEDHCAYLPSGWDENVKLVLVQDKGSQPQCAPVNIACVPGLGIVDSRADITIVGKQLFLKIAAVKKLKRSDCKPADKLPKIYDWKLFSLQVVLELEIKFEEKMSIIIYVKIDACDQL